MYGGSQKSKNGYFLNKWGQAPFLNDNTSCVIAALLSVARNDNKIKVIARSTAMWQSHYFFCLCGFAGAISQFIMTF